MGGDAEGEAKKGFQQPRATHEQWHTDFSRIRICGTFYYFVSVMDGYSLKTLSWGLFENREGLTAEIVLMKAREPYPDAHPRIITDNGPRFISKDFRELVSLLETGQTFSCRFNVKTGRSGHVCGDRYKSVILPGEPSPEAKEADWGWVKAITRKEIAGFIPYKLSWASPRRVGGTVKGRFSFKTPPVSANPPGEQPLPRRNQCSQKPRYPRSKWSQKRSVPTATRTFETASYLKTRTAD
jgi:hypothetical protein